MLALPTNSIGRAAFFAAMIPIAAVISSLLSAEAVGAEQKAMSITECLRSSSSALRDEAIARRGERLTADGAVPAEYARRVLQICDLHAQVHGHPRWPESPALQQLAAKLRKRLLDVAQHLEGDLKRTEIERPAWIQKTLASLRTAARSRSAPARTPVAAASSTSRTQATGEAYKEPSSTVSSGNSGAAAGGPIDNGWQLVALIQKTVEPDFWNSAGGPGAIFYFPLKRALVVRGTSEIHGRIDTTLGNLER